MLPIDRTALTAATVNQVPNALIRSALNIAALTTPYDAIDELNNKVNGLISSDILNELVIINVKDYNASGLSTTTTGSITTGAALLTVASTTGRAVGQGITVAGAGAAGALLKTTILAINGLVITLASNASTTVTSANVNFDDTAAIVAAVSQLGAYGILYFPEPTTEYRITSPITVSTAFVTITGSSKGSTITNYGTGAAFIFTADFIKVSQLAVNGNGGAYGAGASGTYGFDLNAANHCTFDDVNIRYHGSHGIYGHGGNICTSILNCKISQCFGDGVNTVSPSGAVQNGNAMSIVNSALFNNTGNGISWKAAGLNLTGNTIEANKGAGVLIDCTGSTLSANGANIVGNYFESNYFGQIKLVNIVGYVVVSVEISGNYFFSNYAGSTGATALIVATGAFAAMYSVGIRKNSYNLSGGKVVTYVDLGDSCRHSCLIDVVDSPSLFTGLGLARCIYGLRSRTVNGLFMQKGYAYSAVNRSDNVYSMSPKIGQFQLPLEEGELLRKVNIEIQSDCTDVYTVTLTLQSADLTSTVDLATAKISGVNVPPKIVSTPAGGGNLLVTWDIAGDVGYYRVSKNNMIFVQVAITNPATGTTMYLRNLAYEVS